MKTAELQELLGRLVGASFLNSRHYLVTAGILLLASISTSTQVSSLETLGLYTSANIASILVTALPFATIKRLHKRGKVNFLFWHVIATGALLGATKATSTGILVGALGLEPLGFALQSRLISGTLLGTVVVILLSILPLLVEDYERTRALLIRDSVARRLAESIAPITSSLVNDLRDLARSKLTPNEVANQLEAVVWGKLRPLSKELWDTSAKRYPQFRLRSLTLRGLRSTPTPTWPMVVIYAIGSPGLKQFLSGELNGMLVIFVQSLGILVSISVANLMKRSLLPNGSVLVAALGVTVSMNLLPDLFGLNIAGYNQVLGLLLVAINGAFNFVLVSTIASGISAKRRQDDELEHTDRIQLDLEAEELSRLLAFRRSAEILHGQVQNRILGSVVRITSTNNSSDELDSLIAQLEQLHNLPNQLDVKSALDQIAADWGGVMAVSNSVVGEARPLGFELVEAIREAITNAHKHGLASEVAIRIEFQPSTISVEVLDDGIGPRNGTSGLGQRLLECLGPWRLTERSEGGAKLSFTVRDSTI